MPATIDTIVFVNNAISVRMAKVALLKDGVSLERVALFLGRKLSADWFDQCGMVVPYPRKASLTLLGQAAFIGYYRDAARRLRSLLKTEAIRRIFIVNTDNLLSNHALGWSSRRSDVEATVLAEGIMNFQDIQLRNRASWRARVKTLLAPLLGLSWSPPIGHLSGSFEPAVRRVISFAKESLKAPTEKVVIIPFEPVTPQVKTDNEAVLVAYTGLCQWMTDEQFVPLAKAYVEWLKSLGFRRYLVKRHPHYSAGVLEDLMPEHDVISDPRSLEDMASELEASTIVSTNCTALVTLRMLRPDIQCFDFGSNYYCETAYFGDQSVREMFQAAGVELVDFNPSETSSIHHPAGVICS